MKVHVAYCYDGPDCNGDDWRTIICISLTREGIEKFIKSRQNSNNIFIKSVYTDEEIEL